MSKLLKVLKKMLMIIAAAIFGFYLLLLLLFYIKQADLIYHPNNTAVSVPGISGVKFQEVNLKTENGLFINGWYVEKSNAKKAVLFCHGNAGNILNCLDTIETYTSLGFNVFVFDYRGFGNSPGKPSEAGTYFDAQTAWNFLVNEKGFKPGEILIVGRSLGGSIASYTAMKNKPAALIIESSFVSVHKLGSEFYPIMPIKLLSKFKYTTAEYLKNIECPVMLVHSRTDEIIPFSHGERLFEAAGSNKKMFWEISGPHNDGYIIAQEKYIEGINKFLASTTFAVKDKNK